MTSMNKASHRNKKQKNEQPENKKKKQHDKKSAKFNDSATSTSSPTKSAATEPNRNANLGRLSEMWRERSSFARLSSDEKDARIDEYRQLFSTFDSPNVKALAIKKDQIGGADDFETAVLAEDGD